MLDPALRAWGRGWGAAPEALAALAPGELAVFNGMGHMGMDIGGGQFIHAPHTGDVVKISSMSERWADFVGARRL